MMLSLPLLSTVQLNIGEEAQTAELSGASTTFGGFVSSILQASMIVAAVIVLLYFVWAGIDWITAGGDSGKIEKARTKITQSIIGIIVLASVVALFALLQNFLGIKVFNFDGTVLDRARDRAAIESRNDRIRDQVNDAIRDSQTDSGPGQTNTTNNALEDLINRR